MIKTITNNIPEFCMSHWLIRIPLIVVFLQQGFDKWPIDAETAASWELPLIVWAFVVLGEIGAGIGLLVGGLMQNLKNLLKELGDLITRFSGITPSSPPAPWRISTNAFLSSSGSLGMSKILIPP